METSYTAIAPAAKGHSDKHYHSSSDQSQIHHHTILSFHSIIIIIVSVISVTLLVALFLLVLMLRRLKSSKNSHGRSFKDINSSSRFNAHSTVKFTTSPDVKGGCLDEGHVRSNVPGAATASANHVREKEVVQVFTYKEMEMATGEFSEGNVIGNGGFGVVFKGVLSDGTVAAIKKLHRDGKQGEHDFRMEVSVIIDEDSVLIQY